MHNFQRLLTDLDVGPMLDALEARPELWGEITARQEAPGSPHHDTESIWLRGPRELTLESVFNDLMAVDYLSMHELAGDVYPLVAPVLRQLGSTALGRVMIVKLKPGGFIDPHEDTGRYAKAFSRFHLVLKSDPGNVFTCDGESVHMQPGELWWFNHRGEHQVRNDSATERIHIIFDAQVPGIPVRALSSVAANPAAGIRIVEAPLGDRIDRMQELLVAHWDEVAKNKQVMVLKPDRERYAWLDANDGLLCLWALDPDGEIVGYSVNFLGPHIHYADLRVCNNDVLFLREDLRPSSLGLRLIRETERAAKARGARLMLWHAKQGTSLDKIMQRLRYGVQDIIYSKEI
jgi:GNAT superfamily N-acetyltransferase